jgi:hypothetical protein
MSTISIKSTKELVYEAKKGDKGVLIIKASNYSFDENSKGFQLNYGESVEAKEINNYPIILPTYANKQVSQEEFSKKEAVLTTAKLFPPNTTIAEKTVFVLLHVLLDEYKTEGYYGSTSADWIVEVQE